MIKSIVIYIVFFTTIFILYKLSKLKEYGLYITLGFVFMILKDILIYLVDNNKKYISKFSFKKLYKDFTKSRIGIVDFGLILNRNIIFPVLLIIYMLYLVIIQTKIGEIYKLEFIQSINQNYLLGLTIFFGILTVFRDKNDDKYFKEELEGGIFSKNIILIFFLSLLGTYIIFVQVVKLGFLVYPISIISGILIFLVGISILEDDENENNLLNNN